MKTRTRVKELKLHTTQGDAGSLTRQSQFVVRYNDEALRAPERAISLTMPPRPEGWRSNQIPPVLAMNLPEGFLKDRVTEQYRKVLELDDMNLLGVTSTPSAGRVWTSLEDAAATDPGKPVALRDILAYRGTEELFDLLLEKYSHTAISGVQPKVVVPERSRASRSSVEKSMAKSPDLIVKAAGPDYPGLAENEFICMSVAKHTGIETPEFWLSEDRKLFVIRRFDLGNDGYFGFEDMAALTGRHPDRKYDGSYADVARAVALNVAPAHRAHSLDALFRLIVFSCVIRNGDAHLKNFGLVYGDPVSAEQDARLAPAYDLVCTTLYIPRDVLALGLGGTKAWPNSSVLEKFGRAACGVTRPKEVIEEMLARTLEYRHADSTSRIWKRVRKEFEAGVATIQAGSLRRKPAARRQAPR